MPRGPKKGYWLLLGVVAAFSAAYAFHRDLYGEYLKNQANQAGVDAGQQERDGLAAEREALQRHVDELRKDPVEIEASIRRSKNLVRENEHVFRIELPEETAASTPQQDGEQTKPDTGNPST